MFSRNHTQETMVFATMLTLNDSSSLLSAMSSAITASEAAQSSPSSSTAAAVVVFEDEFDVISQTTWIKVVLILIYSIVFLCCFVGNLIVFIVTIIKNQSICCLSGILLANMAVADLLISLFCIYPNLLNFLFFSWKIGKVMCKLQVYIQAVSYSVSVLTVVTISAERYIITVHQLANGNRVRKPFLAFVVYVIWLSSAVLNVPHLVIYDTVTLNIDGVEFTHCIMMGGMVKIEVYTTAIFVVWFCVPVLVLTFCYTRIGMTLWRMRSRSPGGPSVPTSSSENPIFQHRDSVTSDNIRRNVARGRTRAMRLLVAMVVSFIVTMLPYQVRIMWQTWSEFGLDTLSSQLFTIATFIIYYSHSAIHPILYAFLSTNFRRTMKAIFCHRCGSRGQTPSHAVVYYFKRARQHYDSSPTPSEQGGATVHPEEDIHLAHRGVSLDQS